MPGNAGRWLARQREAAREPIPVEVYEPAPMRGRLVERLDGASLAAVAGWFGLTVEGLLGRYEGTSLTVPAAWLPQSAALPYAWAAHRSQAQRRGAWIRSDLATVAQCASGSGTAVPALPAAGQGDASH